MQLLKIFGAELVEDRFDTSTVGLVAQDLTMILGRYLHQKRAETAAAHTVMSDLAGNGESAEWVSTTRVSFKAAVETRTDRRQQ